ncbi:hypothetical protein [Rhizobium sp. SG2393]|uniref:hypothetical protein n=1 Tax=Rhizobium sp. SG2393 TaxID=3276279 RepID=UPI00366B5454
MSNLPDLHDGHAPITLQQLFGEALDAFDDWEPGSSEPTVTHEGQIYPISAVFDRMRGCTDILPNNLVVILKERVTKPLTSEAYDQIPFSTAARVMGILVRRRRRSEPSDIAGLIEAMTHSRPSPVRP